MLFGNDGLGKFVFDSDGSISMLVIEGFWKHLFGREIVNEDAAFVLVLELRVTELGHAV